MMRRAIDDGEQVYLFEQKEIKHNISCYCSSLLIFQVMFRHIVKLIFQIKSELKGFELWNDFWYFVAVFTFTVVVYKHITVV